MKKAIEMTEARREGLKAESREEINRMIGTAISGELKYAEDFFPMFASAHEAYAVTLEEFEELVDDITTLKKDIAEFWDAVKRNNNEAILMKLSLMSGIANHAVAEAIQVAAMCAKAVKSQEANTNAAQIRLDELAI